MLSISADGKNLSTFIILKSKEQGRVYQYLSENKSIKSLKYLIECNSNEWASEE